MTAVFQFSLACIICTCKDWDVDYLTLAVVPRKVSVQPDRLDLNLNAHDDKYD